MRSRITGHMNTLGASSVLVILMMVVLVVFGLAALTTSMAAFRLAEKSDEWTKEYFGLEKQAEEYIFNVDGVLYKAETDAINYLTNENFLNTDSKLFSDEIKTLIYENYNFILPGTAREEYLTRVLDAAFYQSAVNRLKNEFPDMTINYNGSYLRQILEDEKFNEILINTTITENSDEFAKNLDITLRLAAPRYNIRIDSSGVSGIRTDINIIRFEVIQWKEWQNYFDYSGEVEFGNPSR